MALLKCKMCGGSLDIATKKAIIECEYCGTQQTLPKTTDENIQTLFNRANLLRQKNEFDKAEAVFEKILEANDTEAEAYWGVILCKFGIEYVEDTKTLKRIPTCHRTSYDSIVADEYYKKTLEYADDTQREIYMEEARTIDKIQKDILAISMQEEPYDVFICYKETDDNGKRTHDSVIANDIYYQLTQEGFKVFYAPITLEDKLGSAYEPIIFSALNSSKIMLSIGTKPEYFNAIWVKNEWSRFFKMMRHDRSKILIPCYKDMDPYDLPEEFAHLQAQDMSKIGFINDIIRGIKKIIVKDESKLVAVKETVVVNYTAEEKNPIKKIATVQKESPNNASDNTNTPQQNAENNSNKYVKWLWISAGWTIFSYVVNLVIAICVGGYPAWMFEHIFSGYIAGFICMVIGVSAFLVSLILNLIKISCRSIHITLSSLLLVATLVITFIPIATIAQYDFEHEIYYPTYPDGTKITQLYITSINDLDDDQICK